MVATTLRSGHIFLQNGQSDSGSHSKQGRANVKSAKNICLKQSTVMMLRLIAVP